MGDFFVHMESAERIYWYVAIGASVIFIIQTIMTFIGADADTGTDADFDSNLEGSGHAFQLFSFRNLIAFLLGFGWAGVSFYHSISNQFLLTIVSFIVGVLFVAIFFYIMRKFMKLAEDNTFNIENTIGKTADVYITIPAQKQGKGKISVSVKGTLHELDAMSNSETPIRSGLLVKVLEVHNNILLVEAIS